MKQRFILVILAPLVLFFVSCPVPSGVPSGASPVSQDSPQGSSGGSSLTLELDASRGQAVLAMKSGARIDISGVGDDGSVVACVEGMGLATVDQETGRKSLSGSGTTLIVGTRSDGMPGIWELSGGRVKTVIDEESGSLTSLLPASSEHDGTFKGQFGWVYHVMGISEDGKIIIGYAENKKGFSRGNFHIDAGTTIGVYWRVSRHPARHFFLVSRARIIGTFDLSKLHGSGEEDRHGKSWMTRNMLDHLKWFLLDYLTSYLIMVDLNGVHHDSANDVYLVTGTDQDKNPAVATIDLKGNITITASAQTVSAVYVAGYYNAGSNDVAAYWKNDASGVQGLYSSSAARALGVAVSGTDVYAAGYYTNSKGNFAACYWKNGVLVDLYSDTSGSSSARANAIAVSGTDVYAAGWVGPVGAPRACYWKNGVRTDLYLADNSEGLGVAVSGTDVYVAGYYTSGGLDVSCWWKNGSAGKVDLYGTSYSRAAAIAVSGADVYASGYYLSGTALACYWKNNAAGRVDLSTANSNAASIVVSGTDVYVAGYYRNSINNYAACWWKNGAAGRVDLYSDTVTSNQAQGLGICVDGAVVYVAGQVNQGMPGACYWKEGVRTDLYSGGTSVAYSITVSH